MNVELHPLAEQELFEAAAWYDDQVPGLGEDLLAEIDSWITVIAEAPMVWPKWPNAPKYDPEIRRALAPRFPYSIAFQAHSNRITVLAVAHTSRRPFYWTDRGA